MRYSRSPGSADEPPGAHTAYMSVFLFLRIDAVLSPYDHSADLTVGLGGRDIDRERVKALAEVLVHFPDVRVVVSLTPQHWERLPNLQERLAPLPVIGTIGPGDGTRDENLKGDAYKGCTEWLALDHEDRGWSEEERWRLVHCRPGGFGARESHELEVKLLMICQEHIIAPMQTEASRAGVEALFRASPDDLGEAAVRAAQKPERM